MIFKKTSQIIELLHKHVNRVVDCYDYYEESFKALPDEQKQGDDAELIKRVKALKTIEHEADVLRHKVIVELLGGGFLVDSRKSTMRLMEGVDRVADTADEVYKMIVIEKINIDEVLFDSLSQINTITKKQLTLFIQLLSDLMTKYELDEMIQRLVQIETYESEVDVIENRLIQEIFNRDMMLAQKIQYKELVKKVAGMSDLIEDLSDEMEIILASRKM